MLNKKIIFCVFIASSLCLDASSGRKRTANGTSRDAQLVQHQILPTSGCTKVAFFFYHGRPRKRFFTSKEIAEFADFYARRQPFSEQKIDSEWRAILALIDEENEGINRGGRSGFSLRRDMLKYSKRELRKQTQENKDLWSGNESEFRGLQARLHTATSERDKKALKLEIDGVVEQIARAAVRQMFFSAAVAFFEKKRGRKERLKIAPKRGRFTGSAGSGPTQVSE